MGFDQMTPQNVNLTLIVASYKYGHLAAHAIESVLWQTVRPWRILFVDDGVGDCAHLPEIYPEVEYILRPNNIGVVDNFNDMLSRVDTERVLFLGADNWLEPGTIEEVSKHSEDIVTYGGKQYYNDGTVLSWHPPVPHGSALYNVAMAKRAGGYAHSGQPHAEEDTMLFNRMQQKEQATVKFLPDEFLGYRWRHRRNFNT